MTPQQAEIHTLKAIVGMYDEDRAAARVLLDEENLSKEDFTTRQTQALFVALSETIHGTGPVEVLSMLASVRSQVEPELVAEMIVSDPAHMAKPRIAALRDFGRRRRMAANLEAMLALLKNGGSTDEVSAEVERTLRGMATDATRGVQSLDASVMSFIDRLEATQRGEREMTIPTGIEALDFAIGGLQPTLTIVGALPAVGKSALFVTIARNIAARGVPVGVLSLEDEREWLTERIFSVSANAPLFVLGNKPLHRGQMEAVMDSASGVHEVLRRVLVEDSAAMSTTEVVAAARAMVSRGAKAVLVDHLGEIRLERSDRHDLDILEALQDLRGIAKTYRVPVVVACHFKRREGLTVNDVPRLTDFAFSAAIERCARVALGLFRPKDSKDELGVEVLKQTKGPAGYNFRLKLAPMSGTVAQTPPSDSLKAQFKTWVGGE